MHFMCIGFHTLNLVLGIYHGRSILYNAVIFAEAKTVYFYSLNHAVKIALFNLSTAAQASYLTES